MADNDKNERRGRWQGFDLGGGGAAGQGQKSPRRFFLLYILGALVVLFLFQNFAGGSTQNVDLNRFFGDLKRGQVTEVRISGSSLAWKDRNGQDLGAELPPNYDPTALVKQLADQNIPVRGQQPSALFSFLFQWILPFALIAAIYIFLFRRMAGGGAATALNLGKNRVKIYDRKEMKTNFADVAGLDEAVEELKEIVEFLSNPKKYQRLGGRIPKGVLLLGPPGCGKTLLARAVAGEAGVPFFYMSGSEFVEMFVGLGAARVRELFSQAKDRAPCLVFLDELDTIGKTRAGAFGGSLGSHDEREQTLNQLLVEMDGFDASKGVIIMAATNRPDVLDAALLRPGRFDRQVVVDRPDLRGREAILKVHARGVAIDPAADLRLIASRTPGFTGADLANVINEAALLAARREKNLVGMEELEEAIDRVVAGLERKSRMISEKEKVRVAAHEMGHALVALRLKNIDPVHRVTIIPRGAAALGITMTRPLEDRYIMTEPELLDRLAFALGGRAAEEIMFGSISTGAQDDLRQATDIARAMVSEYGMSQKIGPISISQDGFRSPTGRALFPGERPEISEETARMIDQETTRLLKEARERAQAILQKDRDLLNRLSKVLIEREVIEGKDLRLYADNQQPIPTPDELAREAAEKRNGQEARDRAASGPAIIPSRAAETQELPARPDA
ncbi:MAG TPA: ATP-dependent zinc metalloprotease FtsH [Actinomycetota bacterium]